MLTYGDITRDPASLPATSVAALLSRGFSHYLGNEQASKVVSRIRTAIATSLSTPEREVNQADITKEQVQDFRTSNPELVATFVANVMSEALKALDEGTIGSRATGGGPRLDPIAKMIQRVAREFVTTKLQANGLKVPKGEETIEIGGKAITMAELVTRQIAANADVIEREANKRLNEAKRKLEKARVGAETAKDLEGLGL